MLGKKKRKKNETFSEILTLSYWVKYKFKTFKILLMLLIDRSLLAQYIYPFTKQGKVLVTNVIRMGVNTLGRGIIRQEFS